MLVTQHVVQEVLSLLDQHRQQLVPREARTSSKWERKRKQVRNRLASLSTHITKAASLLHEPRRTGRPRKLTLEQRTHLFLLAMMLEKSNRDMESLLELFYPLFGFRVSYKSIERLYSDEGVRLVLHNLFVLMLKDEGASGEYAGDGTGYSLHVKDHYQSKPSKRNKAYRYSFRLIDLNTGFYVAYGYSSRSEMDAYYKAMDMARGLGISIRSIALDRYYSSRKVLQGLGKNAKIYVIPKKNIARVGMEWSRIIRDIVQNTKHYLRQYYRRNLSESAFSADKQRFGRVLRQRKDDRREMALHAIALLHNLFITRVAT